MKKGNPYFLSYILRHKPEDIHIEMDSEGWINVKDFIQKSEQFNKMKYSVGLIRQIVKEDEKGRFSLSEDGRLIRARQGHSTPLVNLSLNQQLPPEVLYHGTSIDNIEPILSNGVLSMNRQYVHLSADKETALNVGSRHGKPHVFEINTKEMVKNGFVFYLSENHVWLTKEVPNMFIK